MAATPLYLDYNATAPLRAEVLALMQAALAHVGNASSVHGFGRAARMKVDAVLLPSPYALSFGGFVNLPTSAWFAAGGVVASMVDALPGRRAAADPLPADMSTTSLVGGGLIAGDALAAVGLGIAGLLFTAMG